MPANKNAMTRYALIDRILANPHGHFSIKDITEAVSEQLEKDGYAAVSKRCIEKDLEYLQYDSPFGVEIEEYYIYDSDRNDRPYRKRCIRYADPTFSIFKPKLTDDEKTVLASALDVLGSFDGLENFEWLTELRSRLQLWEGTKIISFSKNLLTNSGLIARLFTSIRMKQVIRLEYRAFDRSEPIGVDVIPRLLKEYNNRWYLIASACDTGATLTFALDRIQGFDDLRSKNYLQLEEDLEERFDEIIGVTFNQQNPVEEVVIWVSAGSKDYVLTKPLHGSQTLLGETRTQELRKCYPYLEGGAFFRLRCRCNYELIRELTLFGSNLLVLSPAHIVESVKERIEAMRDAYQKINPDTEAGGSQPPATNDAK